MGVQTSPRNYQYLGSPQEGLYLKGPTPGMRPADALTAIQTMADHSQKWHDGTTSKNIRSSSSKDGLAALVLTLVLLVLNTASLAVTYLSKSVFEHRVFEGAVVSSIELFCTMRILREEKQEVRFDLRPSEWLDMVLIIMPPHKLHNFSTAFRERKLGVWFFLLAEFNARTLSLSSAEHQ
ncbi:hypothetical protein Tco_0655271 [Tanacetum coccineum]|uniref:Uncharacterized protein n=1 Tax=Tanacetum coccineum TaxID=301880 RepID=A0ABQ4X5V6_9ASTR